MAPSLRKMLTALTTALAFSAASVSTTALAADKKVTISQAFQSMLYLPLYVAIDGGFFTKEGLDVTKQTAGSPSAALSAVLSGSADFSLHGPEWTAIAAAKGLLAVPAKIVNSVFTRITVALGQPLRATNPVSPWAIHAQCPQSLLR